VNRFTNKMNSCVWQISCIHRTGDLMKL